MVNKTSPGGREGKKIKKGINIFSKKGFLRGGHTVAKGGGPQNFLCALTRANCATPLNKSPRTLLLMLMKYGEFFFFNNNKEMGHKMYI